MTPNEAKLENLIGHKFADPALLERSITHRSWAFENMPGASEEELRNAQNESIEFLGDSVLGLVIAEQILIAHPHMSEGELTLIKHHLVSTVTLAKIAEKLDIGKFVRVGRGEEKTGGRKRQALLANTLEAIIGAVFLDGGYIPARFFVVRLFAEDLKTATPENSIDYKSALQEVLQAQKLTAPTYSVVKTEGPPHDRTFFVEAVWPTGSSSGNGGSIKAAEMVAAAEAIKMLRSMDENISKQAA